MKGGCRIQYEVKVKICLCQNPVLPSFGPRAFSNKLLVREKIGKWRFFLKHLLLSSKLLCCVSSAEVGFHISSALFCLSAISFLYLLKIYFFTFIVNLPVALGKIAFLSHLLKIQVPELKRIKVKDDPSLRARHSHCLLLFVWTKKPSFCCH